MYGPMIPNHSARTADLIDPPRAFVDTGVFKWGIKTDAEIDARKDSSRQKQWLKAQARAVRSLAGITRQEKLLLCHEVEIDLEVMHSTSSAESRRINALLAGIRLHRVDSPFKHSRMLAGWGVTKESADNMREEMLDFAIANYPRMREIHGAIGGNKKADAYHIWTAECTGVEFFVSMDKKLVNSARNQRKVRFQTEIVYPTELINRLGLET